MKTLLLQALYMNVTNTSFGQIYKKRNHSNFSTNTLHRRFPGLTLSTLDAFQWQQLHLFEPPLQMQPRAHLAQPGGQQEQQPKGVRRWTDQPWVNAALLPLPLPPLRGSSRVEEEESIHSHEKPETGNCGMLELEGIPEVMPSPSEARRGEGVCPRLLDNGRSKAQGSCLQASALSPLPLSRLERPFSPIPTPNT